MRTNKLIKVFMAVIAALAMSSAVLATGATAHQHNTATLAAIRATQPTSFSRPPIVGTTYYVSPNGSDANSGLSPAQAWNTVGVVTRP